MGRLRQPRPGLRKATGSAALQSYLAGIDPVAAPVVVGLDDAVRAAAPDLDVAIKYRILTYAIRGDWRTWVCAVQATKKSVCLHFLYGVLLVDPKGVLRAGTSVLKTWDMGFEEVVDVAAVGVYVSEAVEAGRQLSMVEGDVQLSCSIPISGRLVHRDACGLARR